MNYLIHATPIHPSLCLQYLILLFTIATITIFTLLLLLLFYYCHHYKTVATNKPLQASMFSGADELTTHLLRLINILWLPLYRINKFGFYFPRRLLRTPILVGHQDYFLAPLPGSIALFVSLLRIYIVRCNPFIMGKPRDGKVPIWPSTTRRGTTLNTYVTLDSPSVMSKLLTPLHAHAIASTEFENDSDNFDDASTVLDESGSLGSFLEATIARTKQMGNATVTPSSSPESREHPSDDFDDAYIELDDAFIDECHATSDGGAIRDLLARRAVRYKLSPDAKFAASLIHISDKDYDFSLDLSYISIVDKEPFCGTESKSAMEHMNELSSLSNLLLRFSLFH
jgi:hypothetical protein